MQEVNVRKAAFEAACRIFYDGVLLKKAEEQVKINRDLSKASEASLHGLLKGLLEQKVCLDAVLSGISSTPVKKIRPKLLVILELGLYEILFTDTEAYASVNEYVKLAGKSGFQGLKGFVNAVLRKAAADGEACFSNLSERERLSVPKSLWDQFCSWYPEEIVVSMFHAMKEGSGKHTIRRMQSRISEEDFLRRLSEEGIEAERTGLTEDTYYIEDIRKAFETESFKNGLFYIQDLSSSLVVDCVSDLLKNADENFRCLDLCAAPGGKTLHAADLSGDKGHFLALDKTDDKAKLISENAKRLQLNSVESGVSDASLHHPEYDEQFDLVICDVPCSGLGVIGSKPDILYHTSSEGLKSLEALQKKILENGVSYLKKGGTLLYSTCTENIHENRLQFESLLKDHKELQPVDFTEELSPAFHRDTVKNGYLELLPGRDPGDGFFAARAIKK